MKRDTTGLFALSEFAEFLRSKTVLKRSLLTTSRFVADKKVRLIDVVADTPEAEARVLSVVNTLSDKHYLDTQSDSWAVTDVMDIAHLLMVAVTIAACEMGEEPPLKVLRDRLVEFKKQVDRNEHDCGTGIEGQLALLPSYMCNWLDVMSLGWERHSGDYLYPVTDDCDEMSPSALGHELEDLWDEESSYGMNHRDLLEYLIQYANTRYLCIVETLDTLGKQK